MNKPQGSAAPPEQEAPLTAYKLQISGKFSPDGWDGAVQGFADGWRAALAAPPRPLTALVRRFLEWDQLRPPMSGDHAFWKREFEAALAASPRPLTEPRHLTEAQLVAIIGHLAARLRGFEQLHRGIPEIEREIDSLRPLLAALHEASDAAALSAPLPLAESRAAESEPTPREQFDEWWRSLPPHLRTLPTLECASWNAWMARAKLSQESRAGSAVSELRAALQAAVADKEREIAAFRKNLGRDPLVKPAWLEQARATLEASKGSEVMEGSGLSDHATSATSSAGLQTPLAPAALPDAGVA